MAMIFIYLKFKGGISDIKPFILGVIIFTGIFIKCLFSGYEYIAAPLVMMIVPLVYYGILNRLNFYRSLKVLVTAVFSSCLAILLSFIILCVQIGSVKGNFMEGVDHIVYSLEKRSYGNSQDFPSIYTTSLESSAVSVLSKYLNGSFFGPKKYLSSSKRFVSKYLLRVHYSYVILLFMIMSGIVYFLRNRSFTEKEKQTHLALIFSTWFSILSPLSWFIVFKAHSYIHTNANFIVWHMPFIFFGFAVSGLAIKSLLSIVIPINNPIHPIQ